jgi:hypothetical protein
MRKLLITCAANHQHYIPIVDSAIYRPNPDNATDAYAVYDRGNSSGVFMHNPDGSEYIGAVWPGYTVFPDWHADQSVPWWVNEMAMWYKDIKLVFLLSSNCLAYKANKTFSIVSMAYGSTCPKSPLSASDLVAQEICL